MANTIKLETNVPVTGTIKQVWYQKSTKPDWSDQIKLVGTWDKGSDKVDGNIYLHTALESHMQQKGIIGARNGDAFPVLGAPRVQLFKKEEGGKKFVEISLLSVGGSAAASGTSAPQQGAAAPQNRIGDPVLHWHKIQLTMASCLKTARKIVGMEYGNDVVVPLDAIQLCANVLFNERARNGMFSSPPAPLADQALKDAIAQGGIKLNQDEAWLKAELLKVGCTDINKLTVAEGQKVLEAVNSAVAAMEAAKTAPQQQGNLYGQGGYESADIPF
jgi:hypothetical protein